MQLTLDPAQIVMALVVGLIGLVIQALKTRLERIETDAIKRSEKNEARITELESRQQDAVTAITDLKSWLKDQLTTLKLELVQGHPTKEDVKSALGGADERISRIERDLAGLSRRLGSTSKRREQYSDGGC